MNNIITEQTFNHITNLLSDTYKEVFGHSPKVIDFGVGITASGVTKVMANCDGTEIRLTLCNKGLNVTTWFSEPWCEKVLKDKKKSAFSKWREHRQKLKTLEDIYNDISSMAYAIQA